MMAKRCAKCDKTVYQQEELRCLHKSWHKLCFKCGECGMILNLKNYKGYNKIPYCNAHYPQLTATAVVDAPEMKRAQKLTQAQSTVAYHAEYERQKGQMTSIADDPEMIRAQNLGKIISPSSYQGGRDDNGPSYTRPQREPTDDEPPELPPIRPAGGNQFSPPGMQQAPTFVAMYDYDAQDADEVSFVEGDAIVNYEPIDDGWMYGTVERTGQRGMIPTNYVNRA